METVNEFSKEFFARTSVSKMNWKIIENVLKKARKEADLSEAGNDSAEDHMLNIQEKIMNATILHQLCVSYPLPSQYIYSFLKTLISKIEEFNCEIHSHLLEMFTTMVSQKNTQLDDIGHRIFLLNDSHALCLYEHTSIISNGTTGLCTWQAAFYLAEWCIHNSREFRRKKVIELGSGSGFVGLTCLKKCHPSSVILTDYHPKVLESLQYNVSINFKPPHDIVRVESLDWVDVSQNPGSNLPQVDIVLASDVVYDKAVMPALVGTLKQLLQSSNKCSQPCAVVACTVRNEDTLQDFLTELEKCQLSFDLLDHAPPVFRCERVYPVCVYRIVHHSKEQ